MKARGGTKREPGVQLGEELGEAMKSKKASKAQPEQFLRQQRGNTQQNNGEKAPDAAAGTGREAAGDVRQAAGGVRREAPALLLGQEQQEASSTTS